MKLSKVLGVIGLLMSVAIVRADVEPSGSVSSGGVTIGTPVTGGQANSVLYEDASQNLTAGYFLKFDDTTGILTVGGLKEGFPGKELIGQVSLHSGSGGTNTYFNLSGTNGSGMSIRGKHYSDLPVTDPMGMILSTDGGDHYAKLTSVGLGINTIYPQAALDVTGDAVVSGTVTVANGITVGSGGTAITKHLSATASLDFGATEAGTCDSLTITVTGAADGDTVSLGIPNALAASDTYQSFQGFVSSANTVTVKRCNLLNLTTALSDPGAETVRADVWQH